MSLYFNHSIIWYNNYNPHTNNKLIIVYIIIAKTENKKKTHRERERERWGTKVVKITFGFVLQNGGAC